MFGDSGLYGMLKVTAGAQNWELPVIHYLAKHVFTTLLSLGFLPVSSGTLCLDPPTIVIIMENK